MKRYPITFLSMLCFGVLTSCQTTGVSSGSDSSQIQRDFSSTDSSDTLSSPEAIYCLVTFDSRGGSEVESQSVLMGNPVSRPATPIREGYFLTGWYEDEETTDAWDFDSDRVQEDMTLYAGWEEEGTEIGATESLVYEPYGDGYAVTDVGEETVVVIPAEHYGLPVVAIRGEYGTGAFASKGITSITIPNTIVEIANNSFYNCTDLREVDIPEDSALETIGRNAFSGCLSLENIYLPSGVSSIGESAFNNCASIDFEVASDNETYRSENGHLIQREGEVLIRGGQNGIVPEGVDEIGNRSFTRSTLEEIELPSSVSEIADNAFDGSERLTRIDVDATNPTYSSQDGVLYDKEQARLIHAPENLQGEIALPENLPSLPMFAFDGRTLLTQVEIGTGLESIAAFAFRSCTLTISYAGSQEEWESIAKNSTWDQNAEITFIFGA